MYMCARMKRLIMVIALLLCGLLSAERVAAQYYSWGADPASFKWMQAKGENANIIYPSHASKIGLTTLYFTERMRPYIDYGFKLPPLDIPFVIHPENMNSNGLVMWLPKRVEFLSSPSIDGYSMPWLKQLSVHEQRHAVQYNNLNRHTFRALYYLLGEQGALVCLIGLPLWALEGDATMIETDMSTFGRGRQPSFTIGYRAKQGKIVDGRNPDRWFCGSYREHIPDHYHIGYQVTAYADTKYDENIWDRIVHYAVRNPYVFATTAVALK